MADDSRKYVSRSARKLIAAMDAFGIRATGLICADLGCNVGGFTEVLLERGAKKVFAVDTGYGALAYKLRIDFGPDIGIKRTSAQITVNYACAELVDTNVAAVVNFPPKQIGKFMSEVLVLGFPDENGEVVLIRPDQAVPNGGRLY